MRLPRNLKMLRGPVDSSMLAGTLFLLWTVTMLHSSLVMPPGIRLRLPAAPEIWGEVVPDLSVAVDPAGRLLFEHQLVTESNLQARLAAHTARAGTNQTLLLLVDGSVRTETVARLVTLARSARIRDVVLGTSPRPGANGGGSEARGGAAAGRAGN